ncbi:GMP reductase 1 [Thelohanellus kitauei]|uniref:GMP reductase 1 n=1 Tax=Thelohanellus kitauei TaxID=669202 RepID=A0A0C2MAD5_THEKT|nr:GMP reductase 1 [Thelohanellus kitauei]
MRIETDIKLDFKDVLIRPKRSVLTSRSEVSLERTFNFRNSKNSWTGIPIMASNMDSTGTLETAKVMGSRHLFTCLHKFISLDEWKVFAAEYANIMDYVAVSCGTSSNEHRMIDQVFFNLRLLVNKLSV